MEYLLFQCILVLSNVLLSKNCVPTFHNNTVYIGEDKEEKLVRISGCINSSTLGYENATSLIITVKDQTVQSLNSGAVSNIEVHINLKIVHNRIEMVKENAFVNLPRLENMYVEYNHLETIEPYAFENLPSLVSIYLQHNNIKMLPMNTFFNLPNLKVVYLSDNNIEKFNQNWFAFTPQLKRLVINNNRVTFIDMAAFQFLESLESIAFNNNKIQHLHPLAFSGLTNLLELDLGHNKLLTFEIKLTSFRILERLGLNHNRLTYISMSALKDVQYSLSVFYMQSNPLQCACVEELYFWARRFNIDLFFKCQNRELYCVFPFFDDAQCVERSQSEFNLTTFDEFNTECLAISE